MTAWPDDDVRWRGFATWWPERHSLGPQMWRSYRSWQHSWTQMLRAAANPFKLNELDEHYSQSIPRIVSNQHHHSMTTVQVCSTSTRHSFIHKVRWCSFTLWYRLTSRFFVHHDFKPFRFSLTRLTHQNNVDAITWPNRLQTPASLCIYTHTSSQLYPEPCGPCTTSPFDTNFNLSFQDHPIAISMVYNNFDSISEDHIQSVVFHGSAFMT